MGKDVDTIIRDLAETAIKNGREQAMRIAIVAAGFTPDEADKLRRAMATFKHTGGVSEFGTKPIEGTVRKGHDREFEYTAFSFQPHGGVTMRDCDLVEELSGQLIVA